MDLLKISTTTTSSKSSFSIDSLLDRGQKEAVDAEDVPNEDEVEVDISITEDLQRPPPILIKPTPRLPFEDSEELDCTEVNNIYLFQKRKIICIYVSTYSWFGIYFRCNIYFFLFISSHLQVSFS